MPNSAVIVLRFLRVVVASAEFLQVMSRSRLLSLMP